VVLVPENRPLDCLNAKGRWFPQDGVAGDLAGALTQHPSARWRPAPGSSICCCVLSGLCSYRKDYTQYIMSMYSFFDFFSALWNYSGGMANARQKLVPIPMSDEFIGAINRAFPLMGYATRAEFIRDAVYEAVVRSGVAVARHATAAPSRTGKGGKPSHKPTRKCATACPALEHQLNAEVAEDENANPPSKRRRKPGGAALQAAAALAGNMADGLMRQRPVPLA